MNDRPEDVFAKATAVSLIFLSIAISIALVFKLIQLAVSLCC
jgi:hypothetical protein